MLLGARVLFSGGKGGWGNPYITDGLIAMWDAEWNVGGGKHDAHAMVWKDLSGNGYDMLSNGNPIFYDNYISPTQYSEMFHTAQSETEILGESFTSGKITMAIVGECVVGKNSPRMLTRGATGEQIITFRCADPTRVGFYAIWGGSIVNYSSLPTKGQIALVSDGMTSVGTYRSGDSILERSAVVSSLPVLEGTSYPLAIGYRYTYQPADPMVNGEKVFTIRIYSRTLTADEIAHNYAIDKQRFGV